MKIIRINPPGSPTPKNYHHVVSVQGGRTVYLAGQLAFDENRNIVGGDDIIAQTHQALTNLKRNVEAAGASMTDVVKINTYVVNYDQRNLRGILDVIGAFFPAGHQPTNTLLGIDCLAAEGLLIEIEGIAVTDNPLI